VPLVSVLATCSPQAPSRAGCPSQARMLLAALLGIDVDPAARPRGLRPPGDRLTAGTTTAPDLG
jgi:hypothetical protein